MCAYTNKICTYLGGREPAFHIALYRIAMRYHVTFDAFGIFEQLFYVIFSARFVIDHHKRNKHSFIVHCPLEFLNIKDSASR